MPRAKAENAQDNARAFARALGSVGRPLQGHCGRYREPLRAEASARLIYLSPSTTGGSCHYFGRLAPRPEKGAVMIRSCKHLGLALTLCLVIGAAYANPASAQFESEAESTVLTVSSNETQKYQLSEGGLTIECSHLTLRGLISSAFKKAVTVAVGINAIASCANVLGQAVTVIAHGVHKILHLSASKTVGTIDYEGSGTEVIEIRIGSICTYTIGTQTGLSSVTYKNIGSGTTREIIVEPNVTGITSTRTTNDLFCPAAGSAGTYKGNFTLTGENEAGTAHIGVFVD